MEPEPQTMWEVMSFLEGLDRDCIDVALGDIVKLKKPYLSRLDEPKGPYPFGIVGEIVAHCRDGRVRNVSLFLYDPEKREIFMGPNNIPEFVDFHTAEFTLWKKAEKPGYASEPQ